VDRKFENIEEMDQVILSNLESNLEAGDTLYYLGDLTFKENVAETFFNRFNHIDIHYIIGNHDNMKVLKVAKKYSKSIAYIKDIKIEEINITLCHYAMRVWNLSHFNAWQLYGHSHGTLRPRGKQYDVGVDSNQYNPISFDYLKKIMTNSGNNENYLPPDKRRS
jgi:calcineurin-like phosphoesterase family protein